jgi:trans-aconitate methyltransferase
MRTEPVRASSEWLALREPADAAARSSELVDLLAGRLPGSGATIHDLGCGTGAMARWLAARIRGPQDWVMYDRDAELLVRAQADPPARAADGAAVTVETREGDVTRLEEGALVGATLITASALLDMLTAPEVERLVTLTSKPRCPVLITLSVVGRVELSPHDPFDDQVMDAFNDHQRRATPAGRLLGPDAVSHAVDCFRRSGLEVAVRPSPWRLGTAQSALAVDWFTGWLAAACEQRPDVAAAAVPYAERRRSEAAAGTLSVTVHHEDILALPSP